MSSRKFALMVSCLAVALPGWSEVSVNSHDMRKGAAVRKVCVLPAEADLKRLGMKGGESLSKESEDWAAKLGATVQHAVTEAGGTVIGDFSPDALQRNEETRQTVVRLMQKYDNIGVQLRKKPGGVEKGRFTLGDEVALLPCAADADSLAFIDGGGLIQTGGRKAFDVLAGGAAGIFSAQSRFEVWVTLVDAKTGQVTAFVRQSETGEKAATNPDDIFRVGLVQEFKRLNYMWQHPAR